MTDDLASRCPELLGVRCFGTVRWFKEDKGYGRITADDGEVLWFRFAASSAMATSQPRRDSASRSSGTEELPIMDATLPRTSASTPTPRLLPNFSIMPITPAARPGARP